MAESERVNPFSNSARALFEQGVGMGWGDEGEAWLRSKLANEDYDTTLADLNKKYSKYKEEYPVSSTALEFGGAAVPAVGAMLLGPETGGAAPVGYLKALYNSPYARNAMLTGPLTGSIQGAGMAAPEDRGLGFAEGAVIGGVTGAATPLIARTGVGALNWLRDRIAPSEEFIKERALGKVSEAIGEDNLTPRDVKRTVMYDYARGIPSTIANATPSLVSLADTVAQRSGPSGRLVDRVLGEQKAGARERVYQRARNEISGGNYYEDAQRLSEDLSAKAQPLYDTAYAHGEVDNPFINELLVSPRFQSFFRKGQQIAKDKQLVARANGEDPSQYELRNIYSTDPATGETVVSTLPDVRTLDYIKKGIDAQINSLFKAGKSTDAYNLKDMREVLLNKLDDAVPAYKTARREYAGDKEVINAMEAGYKDFPHLDHEEIQSMLGKMSNAEKEAFKTGVVRHIHSVVMDPSSNMNAAARVIESPETQKSLKELFDSPAHFDLYKSALLRESQLFQQANQIMGGAQTGRRIQSRERFEQGPAFDAAITDAVSGVGPWKSLQNIAARVANRAVMPDKIAHKVSELLMSKDPHDVAAAVKALEDYDARAITGAHISEHVEGGLTMGASNLQQTRQEANQDKEINYDIGKHERMLEGPDISEHKYKNIPGDKMGATE
jgi:hypothetical protein